MLRSAASKAMWVGRTTAAVIGLAIALAIVFGVATMALAAVPGDPFKLGKVNSINRLSTLVGTATSPMLRVQNKGTGTALDLRVQQGKPPLTTNSTGRVPRLNADMVDGKHAGAFLPKGGKAADADKLDGLDSTDFVRPRFADIYANGTVRHGRGVVHDPVLTRKRGTGWYQVGFNTNVKDCAFAATISGGFAGMTGVRSGLQVQNTVEVFTLHTSGASYDYPFHLVVVC